MNLVTIFRMGTKSPSQHPRHTLIDVDTSSLKMSFGTASGILITVITVLVGGVTASVTSAFHSDTNRAFLKHSQTPHHNNGTPVSAPASIVPEVEENVRNIDSLAGKIDAIEKSQAESVRTRNRIHARLDFMIERQALIGRGDPDEQRATNRAARIVRRRASDRGEDDPLEGLDGL